MVQGTETVIEHVRELAVSLSAADRLALIRAIASLESSGSQEEGADAKPGWSLAREQEAWFARPAAEHRRYAGRYAAVHGGQVVDDDPDQRTLYLRVRAKYGSTPVLIVSGDWERPPVYTIHGPRTEC
jgi:hypothetical protein